METRSDQLEQQAHRSRARLSATLDELRARMTSGQVIDQLADYAREGSAAEFARNLGREVRENPLPLTLVAIGVAWLVIASGRSARARAERLATSRAVEIIGAISARSTYEEVPDRIAAAKPLAIEPQLPDNGAAAPVPNTSKTTERQTEWRDVRATEPADEQY